VLRNRTEEFYRFGLSSLCPFSIIVHCQFLGLSEDISVKHLNNINVTDSQSVVQLCADGLTVVIVTAGSSTAYWYE